MAVLQGSSAAGLVNSNSDNELLVALSKTINKAGMAAVVSEVHNGSAGLSKLQRNTYSSIEKRLSIGTDSLLWDDTFTGANVNTSRYGVYTTTMTVAQTTGGITLNNSGITTTTTQAAIKTYRTFPVIGNAPLTVDFAFSLALVPQTNNTIEIGLGLPATTTPYAPTEGVYMQIDNAGALLLVANYNGTPTTSGAITFTWAANRQYHGEIVIHNDRCELWIDSVLYAAIDRPISGGTLTANTSQNLYARLTNNAATTGAQKLVISDWSVTSNDMSIARPWAYTMSGMGCNAISIPDGVAAGMTANISNSAAPASATLSNTAAGYTTLGGNWQFAAVAGAETDYALFGYQVPVPAVGQLGKNLMITGIHIEAWNTVVAVATTATLLNWYLGVGSTAVSLATAESATAGGRAPRRLALGTQSFAVGAAVGATATPIEMQFKQPIMVEPGTFVHLILRMPIGTATATEIFRGTATIEGYFE